jgi:putative FmdB family regulatory protein
MPLYDYRCPNCECRFELFRSVHGLRKHNARAAQNAARQAATAAADVATTQALSAEGSRLLEENIALRQRAEGLMVELDLLRTASAAAKPRAKA